MITINLLPIELRPIKRTPLPYIISVVIAGVAALICTQMFIADKLTLGKIDAKLTSNQQALEELKPVVAEYKELVAKKRLLATKLTTINEIASDRVIWSYHLYNLARLAPDNLWYDSIEVTSRRVTEYIEVSDPKTGAKSQQPIQKTVPVLKLTGALAPGVDGLTEINPYLTRLVDDEEFSNIFQVEAPKLGYRDFNGQKVRTFELNCIISPSIGETQ